jgi:ACS family tartrate transporter-like MFS transporter
VEGIPAVLLSAAIWFTLSERPRSAKWLREEEREALEAELEDAHPMEDAHRGKALKIVLRDWRVWLIGFCGLCLLGAHYAQNFFLPEILHGLTGVSAAKIGYLIAVAGAAGAVMMIVNGIHSDRTGERRWHVVVPVVLIALLTLWAGLHLQGWTAAIVLLMVFSVFFAAQAPWVAITTELFCGERAALAIATVNMCCIAGGFLGPYWMGWMRELTGGYAVGLGSLCVPWLMMAAGIAWVTRPRREAAASAPVELVTATEKSV